MNFAQDRIIITQTQHEHADGIADLSLVLFGDRGYPPEDIYTAEKVHSQIRLFPEGQLVAVDTQTGQVVGHTTSMRIQFNLDQHEPHSWAEITDSGWIYKHVPDGRWIYGVDTGVHPDHQGRGIGSRLMRARFDLCRRLGLSGLVGASVIMGYAAVAHEVTPHEYVRQVAAGERFDNNLSKQIKIGFRVCDLIPNYVNDEASLGWGVMIVWENVQSP